MFILKIISRSIPLLTRIAVEKNTFFHKRTLFNQFHLSAKCSSPDPSPVKLVVKKKRKISSSSEESEEAPAAKKIEKSPAVKK